MEAGASLPGAYADASGDPVRAQLEAPWLARLASRFASRGARRVLELGCGGGLGPLLERPSTLDYTGLDFRAPGFTLPGPWIEHDLHEGLGPVGTQPFDLYAAGFGLASHLAPGQLSRLLAEIAAHGRSGSVVLLEALGLYSIEWPRLWASATGDERTLAYAMAHDVPVHPWAPDELTALARDAGLEASTTLDRTIQAGPKSADYWPGLPPVRSGLAALLAGAPSHPGIEAPLPPLPAGPVAAVHQRLAARRRRLALRHRGPELARGVWRLERGSGGGFGHGLVLIARVP